MLFAAAEASPVLEDGWQEQLQIIGGDMGAAALQDGTSHAAYSMANR